jgi:transcriptional regulator with XRE-family HTH domain
MSNMYPFRRVGASSARTVQSSPQAQELSLGARVRALRSQREWTQAELARHAGVSQAFVCQVERNGTVSSRGADRLLLALSKSRAVAPSAKERELRVASTLLNWTPERQALLKESPTAFALAISAIRRAARGRSL